MRWGSGAKEEEGKGGEPAAMGGVGFSWGRKRKKCPTGQPSSKKRIPPGRPRPGLDPGLAGQARDVSGLSPASALASRGGKAGQAAEPAGPDPASTPASTGERLGRKQSQPASTWPRLGREKAGLIDKKNSP